MVVCASAVDWFTDRGLCGGFLSQGSKCEYRHCEGARFNPRNCWYWFHGNCVNPSCTFRHPVRDAYFLTHCVQYHLWTDMCVCDSVCNHDKNVRVSVPAWMPRTLALVVSIGCHCCACAKLIWWLYNLRRSAACLSQVDLSFANRSDSLWAFAIKKIHKHPSANFNFTSPPIF
jgi:hypothetical protein